MNDADWMKISDADLVAEVNRRIEHGDITANDLDIAVHWEDCGDLFGDAGGGIDMHLVDEARSRFICRDYRETLWCLEKALGNEFAGLSDLLPETRT